MINAREILFGVIEKSILRHVVNVGDISEENCRKIVVTLLNEALKIKLTKYQIEALFTTGRVPSLYPCENEIAQFKCPEHKEEVCNKKVVVCRYYGRHQGKTLVHCVNLALSKGEPIDFSTYESVQKYPDYPLRVGIGQYARWFKGTFLEIWYKLKEGGFAIRPVINAKGEQIK